jgi:serpin B
MARALHFPDDVTATMGKFRELQQSLTQANELKQCELRIANRVWLQHGLFVRPSFMTLTQENFGAEVGLVDFDTPQTKQTINDWVSRQTEGKIRDLLQQSPLGPLVVTNALYFHAEWDKAFDAKGTRPLPFDLGSRKVRTPFMYQQSSLAYVEAEGVQILEMPYRGGALSMIVLLPRDAGRLEALESALSIERLSDWLSAARRKSVVVLLPKFKFDDRIVLNAPLAELGIKQVFAIDKADFRGIAETTSPIFIDKVIHQATIEVEERGTTAAAATAVQ